VGARSRERTAWLRAVALVIAVLPAAATTFELAHDVAEQHAICPEHGERIHGDASAPIPAQASDTVRSRSESPASHEHCSVLLATLEAPELVAISGVGQVLQSTSPAPLEDVGAPPVALLATAPKASPPAASSFAS